MMRKRNKDLIAKASVRRLGSRTGPRSGGFYRKLPEGAPNRKSGGLRVQGLRRAFQGARLTGGLGAEGQIIPDPGLLVPEASLEAEAAAVIGKQHAVNLACSTVIQCWKLGAMPQLEQVRNGDDIQAGMPFVPPVEAGGL